MKKNASLIALGVTGLYMAVPSFTSISSGEYRFLFILYMVTMVALLTWHEKRFITKPISYWLNEFAYVFATLKRWQTVINLATRAIQRDNTYARAYRNRGYAYVQTGKFDEATIDFDKALELSLDKHDWLYLMRGITHLNVGKTGEAFEDALRAEEEGMSSEWINVLRAHGHYVRHEYDKSIYYAQAAIEKNPNNASMYALLPVCYNALDRPEEAQQAMDEALRLFPVNALVRNSAAFLQAIYGNYHESLQNCEKAIDLDPKQAIYYSTRSHTHFLMSNYEAALTDNLKAYELKPDEKGLLAEHTATLYAMGKPEKALEKWQELQDIPSAEPHTVDSLQADYRWADQFVETLREVEALYRERYSTT